MDRRQIALGIAALLALVGLAFVGARMIGRKAAEAAGKPATAASFAREAKTSGVIVFLGDSLTAEGPWAALFRDAGSVLNRGIPGDTSGGVLQRLGEVTARKPRAIILMIGTNDLLEGISSESAADNVAQILDRIHKESPDTAVTLQAVLPAAEAANPAFAGFVERARGYNARLRAVAGARAVQFLDYSASFAEANGQLRSDLTDDGLHLRHSGYALWSQLLARDVAALR
jgi:lysophospholipase L1-like esterase